MIVFYFINHYLMCGSKTDVELNNKIWCVNRICHPGQKMFPKLKTRHTKKKITVLLLYRILGKL